MKEKKFYDFEKAVEYDSARMSNNKVKMTSIENEFYMQYKPLVIKMRSDLEKRLNKTFVSRNRISELLSEYEFDAYEQVVRAVQGINISKIPNKADKNGRRTWSFYAPCWGYLMSFNRDLTRAEINNSKNERTLSFETDNNDDTKASQSCLLNEASLKAAQLQTESPEKAYIAKAEKDAFWKTVDICLNKKFNDIQVKIWNKKSEKADKASVCALSRELHIPMKRIKEEMTSMKSIFYKELQKNQSTLF